MKSLRYNADLFALRDDKALARANECALRVGTEEARRLLAAIRTRHRIRDLSLR
ncbi:hypothetical protein OpiT1DRAFT_05691 [Opitutaceae bacterium TAV1]|nr:hypothetical protein OpiT1DRAFT_05691 [Opitutaceae bacterium TAV1]